MLFKYVLYGLLIFLVVQMIRTTIRIKSHAQKWTEEEKEKKPKPPIISIPDIQDAKFEDLTGLDEDANQEPKEKSKEPPQDPKTPH